MQLERNRSCQQAKTKSATFSKQKQPGRSDDHSIVGWSYRKLVDRNQSRLDSINKQHAIGGQPAFSLSPASEKGTLPTCFLDEIFRVISSSSPSSQVGSFFKLFSFMGMLSVGIVFSPCCNVCPLGRQKNCCGLRANIVMWSKLGWCQWIPWVVLLKFMGT